MVRCCAIINCEVICGFRSDILNMFYHDFKVLSAKKRNHLPTENFSLQWPPSYFALHMLPAAAGQPAGGIR